MRSKRHSLPDSAGLQGERGRVASAYLRDPDVRADLLTFVAADDVWLAPVAGGRAWRLTRDAAPVRTPRFSPDGRHLAFVSYADGHPEVKLADVDSGQSQRLTWWAGQTTLLLGWADARTLLVATNAGEASIRHTVVRSLRTDGTWQRLRIGAAGGLAVRADGAMALSTYNARPPAHWKRYRGGRSEEHTSELQSRGQLVCRLPRENKTSSTDNAE